MLNNDFDPKGGSLSVIAVTQPLHGSVQIQGNGQEVLYIPDGIGKSQSHFSGVVTFLYQAQNEKLSAWSNVTVTVLNHPPQAVSLVYTISKNSANNIASVLTDKSTTGAMAYDIDMDQLFVISCSVPSNGSARILNNKTISYTPNTGFEGIDAVSYIITDLNDTSSATINWAVQNDPPQANPDFFISTKNSIAFDIEVLANDVDPNHDPLTISEIRNSGLGIAYLSSNTWIDYYPPYGFSGFDSFEYSCTDGSLL